MSNQEKQVNISGAVMLQLNTAKHKSAALQNQRDGVLTQLTEIQVLHSLEVEARKATQEKLGEVQQQLVASQEQTMKWLDASNSATSRLAAMVWYCEQLLKQSPDSNGMHTLDNNLINDIVATHNSVLVGEKVSTNIADVIRVTTMAETANTDSEEKKADETATVEATETTVDLGHGLAAEKTDSEIDDLDIAVDEEAAAPIAKQKHHKHKKRNHS